MTAETQNPHLPTLRRRALVASAITLIATIGVALAFQQWAGLSPLFAVKASAIPVLLAALAGPYLHQHPFDVLGPANQLTLARSVVLSLAVGFVGEPTISQWPILLVFLTGFAFFLDGIDGQLARRSGISSEFGARLDMELDGLTVFVLCGLAYDLGVAGLWVWIAGLLRYIWIAATFILPWMNRPLYNTKRRAWACGINIFGFIWCLFPWPVASIGSALAVLAVAVVVVSFVIDVAWLFYHRNEAQ